MTVWIRSKENEKETSPAPSKCLGTVRGAKIKGSMPTLRGGGLADKKFRVLQLGMEIEARRRDSAIQVLMFEHSYK